MKNRNDIVSVNARRQVALDNNKEKLQSIANTSYEEFVKFNLGKSISKAEYVDICKTIKARLTKENKVLEQRIASEDKFRKYIGKSKKVN